ncbi:hypothetical protein ANAPH2_01062 [Anaplasma phagocytophilum]|nr:hypothetical protein ANAPH2_01062 [Anaplasma phagocytophilum]
MYRGYASTGNSDHNVAGIIEHCLKILLSFPSTRQNRGAYKARKMYVDMCSVYEDLEQHLGADLLLNPGAEVKLRDAALRYLSEMMEIWEREYGKYFNAVEQTGGSPSQPSTSGMGSTSAGMVGPQASYVPQHDHSYAQPSTSGMGGTGLGSQQASYVPQHDHSYAQPSTSGLGGTAGLGHQQASYVPSHDPGIMPYLWDQPSTSGMGDASSELEEAQVSSHRSRTPSDDSEPPSKRSRSA